MPAKRYAANTNVSSDKSRSQIEKALIRYGATHFGYASEPKRSIIQFEMNHRRIRFVLPMPDPADDQFKFRTYGGKPTTTARTDSERVKVYEQATRQVWAALKLVVLAKLEAVAAGISEFETEFLGHIVVPGTQNQTVAEWLKPQLEKSYSSGELLPMLPGSR